MPTALAHDLLAWYRASARQLPWRRPPSTPLPTDPHWPYRVWLSEVMLQQTTVEAATGHFTAFTSRWPSVAALAAAADEEVMQAWAGLGYYARARNLLACARQLVAHHAGRFPADEASLRRLPGIGPYTAAAMAAFAFGRRAIVIDGNVERVVARLADIRTPLPAARAAIADTLEAHTPDGLDAADFAQGLMDLSARLCTPRNPRCPACPLQRHCRAEAPEALPVRPPRRSRPLRHGTAWWLQSGTHVLTIIRPPRGLLGGMLALPASDWRLAPFDPEPPLPGRWQMLGQVSHGFTHFELALSVAALRLSGRPGLPGQWRPIDALAGMPTVFAKAAALARAQLPEPSP